MGEVKRYDPMGYDKLSGYMQQHQDGDFVHYDDYASLEAENAKLRAELERRADGWKLVSVGADCVTSGMKAACIGEFSFGIQMTCGECVDCGADSDCPVCGGEVEYTQKITVPWDTCKEIYKAMLAAAPSAPRAGSGIYADDPLACNGCVSGCFRCRTSAPKADDPVKVQLLEALEAIVNEGGSFRFTHELHAKARAAIAAAQNEVKP